VIEIISMNISIMGAGNTTDTLLDKYIFLVFQSRLFTENVIFVVFS